MALWRTTVHPRPWQNCRCTCRLPRHPQDGGYKRFNPGALSLVTTFKCKYVAQITSLSSCESLAGTASAVNGSKAATGEPSSSRHSNKLICSWPSVFWCFVSATNSCFQIQARAQGAGRQAGRKQEQRCRQVTYTHGLFQAHEIKCVEYQNQ